jgi:citrate synthase
VLIGKPGKARTAIAHADAAGVTVRGRDLAGDLMGRLSLTEYFFFLLTGREATADQRFFLDLVLVAIAEHGLTPTAVAARMTYAAAPDALQGAVAAGLLGAGSVVLGASESCGRLLQDTAARIAAGATPDAAVAAEAEAVKAAGGKLPGYGHPLHKPRDARAERILALADERRVAGLHVDLARRFVPAAERVWGRALPMNVSMATAAVLLDLDFPAAMLKAIPLLGRTAGLLAHLAEEQDAPIGFRMAAAAEEAITYDNDGDDGR